MRTSLVFLILLCSFESRSQISFERLYNFSQAIAIEELPDHTFIGCGDSITTGVIFHLDKHGNEISSFAPVVRGGTMRLFDLEYDRVEGGVAVCGYSPDLVWFDSTATYLLLNQAMENIDSLFYGAGAVTGPIAFNILQKSNYDFVTSISVNQGIGTYQMAIKNIGYPGTNTWDTNLVNAHSYNGMHLDNDGNILCATYNAQFNNIASFTRLSSTGSILNGYSITNAILGGSDIIESVCIPLNSGNSMFGVDVSNPANFNRFVYLAQLDTNSNLLWSKFLDWTMDLDLIALTPTADSCIVALFNSPAGLVFHKMQSNGDSLWTQFHNRPLTGEGIRFQECDDRGFVVGGQYYDGTTLFGYVLKTDSLGRLLPDAGISAIGNPAFCQGDNVVITALPGYSYLWSTGETTMSVSTDTTGFFFVTVTDSFGVSARSDTLFVNMLIPTQPSVNFQSDTLFSTLGMFYQWYLDNSLIVGASDQFHIPQVNGYYQVYVTDVNGCPALSDSFLVTTVGINENGISHFNVSLSPNPVSKLSALTLSALKSGELKISLINSIGLTVETLYHNSRNASKNLQLPVNASTYKPGIYYLRVENEGEVKLIKVVVEN